MAVIMGVSKKLEAATEWSLGTAASCVDEHGAKWWISSPAGRIMDQGALGRLWKARTAKASFGLVSIFLVTLCYVRFSAEILPTSEESLLKPSTWQWKQVSYRHATEPELKAQHPAPNGSVTLSKDDEKNLESHPTQEDPQSLVTEKQEQDLDLSKSPLNDRVGPQGSIADGKSQDVQVEDTKVPELSNAEAADLVEETTNVSDVKPIKGPDQLSSVETVEEPLVTTEEKVEKREEEMPAWTQFPQLDVEDETKHLMETVMRNGTLPCHNIGTQRFLILGLPPPHNKRILLNTGEIHELILVAIGDDGHPRCSGGDYYETDLSGSRWKSRPPILDNENGTYSIKLHMDPRFAGKYTFKVNLLFTNYDGLHLWPTKRSKSNIVPTSKAFEIEFVVPTSSLHAPQPQLPVCGLQDFKQKYWSGRWTRESANEDCEYGDDGRWRCVDGELQCPNPWCKGQVGKLESNGWSYSAHCAFKIFKQEEAWQCLNNRWLFFYGDSNHVDTVRNLLNFGLGFNVKSGNRRMDQMFFSPLDNTSKVHITSMFNGAAEVNRNREGLFSLRNQHFADQLRSYFVGETAPDFMIMNSGLHDGWFWEDVQRFQRDGVEYAAEFWTEVWNNMTARRPDILYRTTVAAAGGARFKPFNPQKMELYNHLMVDKFSKLNLERFHIIDGFDYTFPWHYDNQCSDGIHYGRPPLAIPVDGHNFGHKYFVDLMLVHMLLNNICATTPGG